MQAGSRLCILGTVVDEQACNVRERDVAELVAKHDLAGRQRDDRGRLLKASAANEAGDHCGRQSFPFAISVSRRGNAHEPPLAADLLQPRLGVGNQRLEP